MFNWILGQLYMSFSYILQFYPSIFLILFSVTSISNPAAQVLLHFLVAKTLATEALGRLVASAHAAPFFGRLLASLVHQGSWLQQPVTTTDWMSGQIPQDHMDNNGMYTYYIYIHRHYM